MFLKYFGVWETPPPTKGAGKLNEVKKENA